MDDKYWKQREEKLAKELSKIIRSVVVIFAVLFSVITCLTVLTMPKL